MSQSCPTCLIDFLSKKDSILCPHCNTWYHYECGGLTEPDFLNFIKNKSLEWKCPSCVVNSHCGKCKNEFKMNLNFNEKSIYCDCCHKFLHLKCAGLALKQFYQLAGSDEPWFCCPCLNIMFPFTSLTNAQFNKLLGSTKQLKKTTQPIPHYNITCNVCAKIVKTSQRKL